MRSGRLGTCWVHEWDFRANCQAHEWDFREGPGSRIGDSIVAKWKAARAGEGPA
jgi:hypothetical protein